MLRYNQPYICGSKRKSTLVIVGKSVHAACQGFCTTIEYLTIGELPHTQKTSLTYHKLRTRDFEIETGYSYSFFTYPMHEEIK